MSFAKFNIILIILFTQNLMNLHMHFFGVKRKRSKQKNFITILLKSRKYIQFFLFLHKNLKR